MRSIKFPDIFNRNSVNLTEDYYATKQNLILLLKSEKGELFGDPYFGAGLKKYLFDQNDSILRDLLIDDIYTAIKVFMPQIRVERNDITINSVTTSTEIDGTIIGKGDMYITIKALNKANFQTDLYNIALLQAEA